MREHLGRPLVAPTLRGAHHLALSTDDMKATIDFYVDVLGILVPFISSRRSRGV